MKNKTKLLLLPATFMMLTACGPAANTKIPRGYSEVDVNDNAAREAFYGKAAENVMATYEKALTGFKVKGSFGVKELSFKNEEKYKNVPEIYKDDYKDEVELFKITDANMDYSMGLVGLDKGINSTKAYAEIKNLGFKLEYTEDGKTKNIKASDIDVAVYFTDGNVYFDLSDKDLKNFVNAAIDVSYSDYEGENKSQKIADAKEEAAKYLDKLVLKDVVENVDEVNKVLAALPKGEVIKGYIPTIKSTLSEAFEGILKDEKTKNLIKLYNDKESKGVAIGIALTSEAVDVGEAKVSGDLVASISCDKEGLFNSWGYAGNVNISEYSIKTSSYYTREETTDILISKLDFGTTMEYGENLVKLPSLDGYKDFPQIKIAIQ